MDIEITESDLTENKLFSFTDSAMEEAKQVYNKVVIAAVFPCIPTI